MEIVRREETLEEIRIYLSHSQFDTGPLARLLTDLYCIDEQNTTVVIHAQQKFRPQHVGVDQSDVARQSRMGLQVFDNSRAYPVVTA